MQHNPLASWKPDPPGPEYLLMTSVCQPHDGRNAGSRRGKEEGEEKWRWKEEWMWDNRQPCETTSSAYRAFTKGVAWGLILPEGEKGKLTTNESCWLLLIMKICTFSCSTKKWTPVEHLLIFWYICTNSCTMSFFAACICLAWCRAPQRWPPPVRDCTVALDVTLHIPSSPGDLGSVPNYWPQWNFIHPSVQCINNLLYTQDFFFFNKPSRKTNLLSICPV